MAEDFESELRQRAASRERWRLVGLLFVGVGIGFLLIYGLRLLRGVTSDSIGGFLGGVIIMAVAIKALSDPHLLKSIDVEDHLRIHEALERLSGGKTEE